MKKHLDWRVIFAVILVSTSALVYTVHYLVFHDVHHIFIYLIGDVAFLFLDVLFVILLIERLLSRREKTAMMKKLNMVIGTFFSEVGLHLLRDMSCFSEDCRILEKDLRIDPNWQKKDFMKAMASARHLSFEPKAGASSLAELKAFLVSKRNFLLNLLGNPNLLEHERFTDLLWAVFHLTEELSLREDRIDSLPQKDRDHIAGDIKRAYLLMVREWIAYTWHLKESYPFLFSLAVRMNPFNPKASVVFS